MDKKNRSLPSFILGLVTGFVFIPVITEALDLVYTYIQAALIKPTKIIIKGNQEVVDIQEKNEMVVSTNRIGFECPDIEEYYYEND